MKKQERREEDSSCGSEKKYAIKAENRISIDIYEGLAVVTRMVKCSSIAERIGKSSVWFTRRMNHAKMKEGCYAFSAADAGMINEALWQIGEELLNTTVQYTENRDEMGKNIKSALKDVFIAYVVKEEMKADIDWFCHRTSDRADKTYEKTFSPKDILMLNLAIHKTGAVLLSLQLSAPARDAGETSASECGDSGTEAEGKRPRKPKRKKKSAPKKKIKSVQEAAD